MASYNGLVASMIKGSSTGGEFAVLDGISASNTVDNFPKRFFSHGQFAMTLHGMSGTISVDVVSSIGGASFVITGTTGYATDGNFVLPVQTFVGTSGVAVGNQGVPFPSYVSFGSGEDGSGLTASVFFAGEY